MVLSSGDVGKYEFLTSKDVLLEKYLLEKAVTIKRFEYSPLGSELKKQTDIAKKSIKNWTSEFKRFMNLIKRNK